MKVLLIIILVFCSLTSNAQFEFKPDTLQPEETFLGFPDLDSIQFEMRLWQYEWGFKFFSQLSFNKQNQWKYQSGVKIYNSDWFIYPEIESSPNLDSLWSRLDSFGILTLPTQEVVTATYVQGEVKYKLDYPTLDGMLPTEANLYQVELFSQNGYRTYFYREPIKLVASFKRAEQNWIAPEHYAFVEIIRSIEETLQIKSSFKNYTESLRKKPNRKDRKRKR